MKIILVIGDNSDWESFLKFKKKRKTFENKKINFKTIDYDSIIKGKLPNIKSNNLLISLFFPLDYWNDKIETNFVKGHIYGDKRCAEMFYNYLDEIKSIIDKKYNNTKISYVNSFEAVKIDRDKELTKTIIKKANVPVPRSYSTRKYEDIIKLLNKGRKLYLKVNFGAMGKGITKLERGKWLTNFIYRKGSIISRKGDYGWKFKDITVNEEFLKKLLKKELAIEEAINPYIIDNKIFDIRYYVVYGKIKHKIVRSAPIENVVTNITQGGIKKREQFLRMPTKYLKAAEGNAIEVAKALGLNLAGIDVMISKRGIPYVLEAQSFPGFPESKYNFSGELAKEIIKHWR
jgi:glutathione synthase/RimK-type ligase-like ATP-grasp enzyme